MTPPGTAGGRMRGSAAGSIARILCFEKYFAKGHIYILILCGKQAFCDNTGIRGATLLPPLVPCFMRTRRRTGGYGDVMPMIALTDEMKEVLQKNNQKFIAVPMATASAEGVPNVAPMASVWLRDDRTIWICDNFMQKTLQNLLENPIAAFYFWDADTKRCFQVKGSAEVKTSGADYEEMYAMVKRERPSFPAKSLIVVTITGVYDCTPGKNAGARLQ